MQGRWRQRQGKMSGPYDGFDWNAGQAPTAARLGLSSGDECLLREHVRYARRIRSTVPELGAGSPESLMKPLIDGLWNHGRCLRCGPGEEARTVG